MRHPGLIVAVALAAACLIAGPAQAAKPAPPLVTTVTITATGGSWPTCEQVATVGYESGHQRAWINVSPALDGAPTEDHMAQVRGVGSIEIAISGHDYSDTGTWAPNDPWRWAVSIWGRRYSASHLTTTFDFDGRCPAAGTVMATWMVAAQ